MTAGDFAMVIGIAHYPWLRPLDGPVGDARRVSDWLRGSGGLPEANVELVVSDHRRAGRPILDDIDSAFDRLLDRAAAAPAVRRLYVYFAGHGCSREIDHLALLMANANLKKLNRSMNAREYRKALAQLVFREQVYLFDCCRNYDRTVSGRAPEWTFDPGTAPVADLVQLVLYAAGFTEYANERHLIYSERRGLFTEALLEGLNGAAATLDGLTGQGIVTTDRLVPYVRDRLDEMTGSDLRQHLWWEPLGSPRPLVLATGVEPRLRRVNVEVPPDTVRVVVRDDRGRACAVHDLAGAGDVVAFDLELAAYTVTALPGDVTGTIRLLPGQPVTVNLRGSMDATPVR